MKDLICQNCGHDEEDHQRLVEASSDAEIKEVLESIPGSRKRRGRKQFSLANCPDFEPEEED